MLGANLQLAIGATLVVLGFGAGWQVNDWRHDSVALVAEKIAEDNANKYTLIVANIADELEKTIASRAVTQRVIERGIIKEIRTNETIYRNVCITDAGRVLINDTAKGRVSSQSATALPK